MKKKAKRGAAKSAKKKPARAKTAVKAKSKSAKPAKKAVRTVAKPVSSEKARLERNKKLVLAFYDHAINEKDFEAASKYMSKDYRQHNPTAADGPEGLRVWLEEFKRAFPTLRATVKKCIAEGDFVVLHVLGENGPCPSGTAVVDIFRVVNGKVAEHWDVIQDIPADVKNANSMF
jgi:predicted SnoaL-like aldol condensation-catalyzing enzyme